MNRFLWYILSIQFLILLSGCSKTVDYGLGDFRLDLATVSEEGGSRYYLLDNQFKLYPDRVVSSSMKTGSRVLLNYIINSAKNDSSFTVSINSVSAINSGSIKPVIAALPDDPLRVESVWLSGDWLNFRLSFNYYSVKHSIDLFENKSIVNDTLYLELHHSRNGDSEGYWVNTYISCNLKSFSKKDTIPVKVRVNTADSGYKFFNYRYATPIPN